MSPDQELCAPGEPNRPGDETHSRLPSVGTRWIAAAGVLWLVLVMGGSAWLVGSSLVPGGQRSPPKHWPEGSVLPRVEGRPTLVLFAHPLCPCTRASLTELERLLARSSQPLSTMVVFAFRPESSGAETADALRRLAGAIPGVVVLTDPGREARRFGAETSGHVVLYDAQGRRVFSGGITAARGHAGANAGGESLLAGLAGGLSVRDHNPVFGCSIEVPPSTP